MLVPQPLSTFRSTQNLGSLTISLAVSMPITSPNVYAIAMAWSWCSNRKFFNVTHVGNARLLGLSGINPRTQLWIMHTPHFDLNGDNIRALWRASWSSLIRKKGTLYPHFCKMLRNSPPTLDSVFATTFSIFGQMVSVPQTLQSISIL